MPTGYTAPIESDPNFTFEQFVWRGVRGLGVCMSMRDEPLDAPIPKEFPLDTYYRDKLELNKKELRQFLALTEEQVQERMEKHLRSIQQSQATLSEDTSQKLARYEAMRQRVQDWEAPSPDLERLKEFLLEQISESTRWLAPEYSVPPTPLSVSDYWLRVIEGLQSTIAYYSGQWEKAQARHREQAAFFAALRASVPQPESVLNK